MAISDYGYLANTPMTYDPNMGWVALGPEEWGAQANILTTAQGRRPEGAEFDRALRMLYGLEDPSTASPLEAQYLAELHAGKYSPELDLHTFKGVAPYVAAFFGAGALGGAMGAAGAGASAGGTAAGTAGIAPEVGALYSGLDAGALAGADLVGAGELGAGLAAGSASGGATGGGMNWLDLDLSGVGDIPGYGGGYEFNPLTDLDLSGLAGADIPGYGSVTPDMVLEPASLWSQVSPYLDKGSSLLKSFLGNASGGGTAGRFLPGGSMFDTALATAPILAAINYARNQDPFDTSRLVSTYNEFTPESLAYEYDQNTARGRNALTSSLTNRGVMGSSFGNADLFNFQTSRDLGRRSLINQGLAQRGNIAASILDAQVKERGLKNDLYGRSLLALGNVFGGRNQAPVYA